MKLPADITKAIQEAALAAGIPISIVTGIVCQESSGNPRATRYEPGFFKKYIIKMGLKGKEGKERATSWGLMQIMGEVARERGFKGPFQNLLISEIGLYWGCRQLKVFYGRYFGAYGWAGVISAYNAGSPRLKGKQFVNQYYVDRVLKFAQEAHGGEGSVSGSLEKPLRIEI
jgi:soluble lytic murein transglycosylase-like protein